MTTTELQAIWDQAIVHLSTNTMASEQNREFVIPTYDEAYLHRVSKHVALSAQLPVLLEQLLQTYLAQRDTPSQLHVLILCDLALAISLRIVRENTSTLCRGQHCDNKLCEPELCLLLITLCDTFCHCLLADELAVVVFYLRQRTRVLCRVFGRWLTALHQHQRPPLADAKNWEFANAQKLELPVLKFCNRVLFRLNHSSNNIETRGQFLIFMANFVDIDSRSGYNLSGQFHLENVTILEAEHALRFEYDVKLYHALWQLQDVFRDPRNMASPQNVTRLAQFRENLDLVLSTFDKNAITDDEANGHFQTQALFAAANGGGGGENGSLHGSNTLGKYLTSTHLFHKQLKNPSFRRYILVQTLIFIKAHTVEFPMETRPKITSLAKFAPDVQQWFLDKYAHILNAALPLIPPHGQQFTSVVKHILQRDEHWLVWKYNKKDARCQPLKRSSAALPAIYAADDDCEAANGDDDDDEDEEDIDMTTSSSQAHAQPSAPLAKRRKLNPQFASFLSEHETVSKDSMLMGDKNLHDVFKYTPAQFLSKRSHHRRKKSKQQQNKPHVEADSLRFLHDYKLINFGDQLQQSMQRLLDEYKENVDSCAAAAAAAAGDDDDQSDDEEDENDDNTHLLNDRRSIFYNLRIMRDFNHDMFSALCPMARQPPPNTFRSDYLMDALRFVAPNDAYLDEGKVHSKRPPVLKETPPKDKSKANEKEPEQERVKVENDENIAHGTTMFPNGANVATKVTRADADVKMEDTHNGNDNDNDKQSTPPSIAASSVVATNSHNAAAAQCKPPIMKVSSSPQQLSAKNGHQHHGHGHATNGHATNGHSSSSSVNGHVSSSSSASKVISTHKKDARDEREKMQERRKRFQMAAASSHSHSQKIKSSSSSHRTDRSHRA